MQFNVQLTSQPVSDAAGRSRVFSTAWLLLAVAAMEPANAYEQERAARIRKNNTVLEGMGINGLVPPELRSRGAARPRPKKPRARPPVDEPELGNRRRSSRLQNQPAVVYTTFEVREDLGDAEPPEVERIDGEARKCETARITTGTDADLSRSLCLSCLWEEQAKSPSPPRPAAVVLCVPSWMLFKRSIWAAPSLLNPARGR